MTNHTIKQPLKYLLAISIGVLPLNIAMVWYRLTQEESFTLTDMLVYPLLIGGGSILIILALNQYLLKQDLADFNPGKARWYWDILAGLLLTVVFFLLVYIEQSALAPLLPRRTPPSEELITLLTGLAGNPVLLAIWLGPVVWIGVAVFEEVQRVFLLNCLWRISQNSHWEWFVILLVSVTWGILHLYQGAFGIVSVSVQGLIMGFFYYRFRRIWPLIISHALYDSIQIIIFVVQVT